MQLKKIEVLGFKSFPNKTTVKFSEGLTAIVGPNGCGKTNILDALRWVLGEQKPTLLRGGKMDEVIFNGTKELKPLGMSEVILTIVNDRGILPTEYHELQIGRRLFRSGESEYLINKVPCRLKDITDLFIDTGMGAHSYSVIQQDMIDSVISDKAEERRFLFEEAAGITKYKQRRKAALRKLEATENDFLRLRDIYAEVKTRVNSLYRQHKKAERYQKLGDEIKGWELYLSANRVKRLETERRELKAQFDELSDQKMKRETSLDQASANLESRRKELLDIEHRLSSIGRNIAELTDEAHGYERDTSVLREKKSNATTLIEKNSSEISTLKVRAESLVEQKESVTLELEQLRSRLGEVTGNLGGAQSAQAEADRELLSARQAKAQENEKLLSLEGRLSSGRTETDTLREQEQEFAQTIAELDSQIQANSPRQRELIAQLETLRTDFDASTAERTDADARRVELGAELEQLVEEGEQLSQEQSTLTAALEACQARRTLLEEMMVHYDGYESGVVSAMENREQWPGLVGTVAEVFVPTKGMEAALEGALGEMAQFMICSERATARRIIDYLKSEGKGRAGILVPDSGTITPVVARPKIDLPGVIGWLDSYVSAEEGHRQLMEAVLSQTLVFESTADPDVILERLPYGFSAVSDQGVLFRKNTISGGAFDRFSLFRRKENIEEQEALTGELQANMETVQAKKSANVAKQAALRAESGELVSKLETLSEEIDGRQKKLSESEYEHRTLTSEFERLEREKRQQTGRLEKIQDRQGSLGLNFDQLASEKSELVTSMTASDDHLVDVEQRASQAAEQVAKLQVSAIEVKSQVEQALSRVGHLDDITAELAGRRTRMSTEIEQARQDIQHADKTTTDLEGRLKVCFEKRETLTDSQRQEREIQAEMQEKTTELEKQAQTMRKDKDTVSDSQHQAEIRLTAIASEINGVREKLTDDYQVDITTAETPRPNEEISDDDALEHLSVIKQKLASFGAVNLLALEEYQVASEREQFLNEQLTDLTTAKDDLKSTISKINNTARQLFMDTLDKVRENFRNLFVELFSGGEADIRLEDPDDPLESNIEIIARPGGKKLLPITMLSGGERALTAISLLFSLYMVKPSPFCILDEIDAPLDDANCHRFLKIIKNFSSQTQFITITHNKITMEAADNLYGITMEQPGVSTLVAVKFTEDGGNGDGPLLNVETADNDQTADPLPQSVQDRLTPPVKVATDDERE